MMNVKWTKQHHTKRFQCLLVTMCLMIAGNMWGQSTANYSFTTNTTGSLALDMNGNAVDMTTGTTQLIAAGNDDLVSSLSNIGFNFIAMGNIYTQFSATSNGVMGLNSSVLSSSSGTTNGGTSAITWIAPFGGDQATNSTGKVHFKIVGSAPNRCLVVEWLNMELNFSSSTADGTYQARFYETSGVIEFVYGSMNVVSTFGTAPIIGFSGGTTSTKIASITSSSNTVSTSGTSFSGNTYSAGAIANLNSTTNGSRRVYRFTPTVTSIAGPTNLTFASVTATGMTLNWTAASPITGIVRYIVQRSTDGGVTFPVSTSVALGTNTLAVTGLTPGTNYTYRVVAVSEGIESAATTGSQTTSAGATYYWVGAGAGADFNTASSWNTLANGTGTGRTTPLATDVLIVDGATTVAGSAAIITMAVHGSCGQFLITNNTTVTVTSTTTSPRSITINGGGGLDLSIPAGSTLNLTNANPAAFAFAGTGNTGDISGIYNASSNTSNVITTTGGTGTLLTVSATGVVNNSIVGSSGCLAGSVATLSFLGGSNYTHSSFTTTALIPLASWAASSNITMNGASTSAPTFTNIAQTFGNVTFSLPSLTATSSIWTTSTAIIQGNLTITNTNTGKLRALTSGTLTVNGNLVVNGGTFEAASSTGTLNVLGNVNINGGTFDIAQGGASNLKVAGNFIQIGGTLTQTSASGLLEFNGTTIQTFTPGTQTGTLMSVRVNNAAGVDLTSALTLNKLQISNGNISGIGSITYNGTTPLLTYNSTVGNQTMNAIEFPATNGPSSLTLNNTSSTKNVSMGFSRTLSGTTGILTLTSGYIDNAGFTLTIPNTSNAAVSGGSANAYVKGVLERDLPASNTTNNFVFPMGKSSYNPLILISPKTNAGGTIRITSEVIDAGSGGTAGNLIDNISVNRYWKASIVSGASNFTSTHIRLTDATTGLDAVAGSNSQTGAYDLIGGTSAVVTSTDITTSNPEPTSLIGFYTLAAKASASLSNLTISPSGNLCTNAVRDITVTVTPGGAAITGVTLNYSVNGVAQTAINMTNTSGNDWTGQIPVVSPTNANVTWSVTATDANSLTKSATGTAYKDEPNFGATATATASPSTLCTGSNTNLSYSVSSLGTGVIGSGSTNSSSSPTPFSGLYGGMKGQYIILASELTAAGYSAGNITSIGINFASATTVTYTDLTIQIGNTSLTAFNSTLSLESGLTTVYGPTSLVNPPAGVLLFNLVSPFNWNGTSNIIISTSWSNNATTSTSASVVTTTTSTNLAQVHKRDSYTPAALLALTGTQSAGSSTVGTARPNFTLIGNKSLAPSSYSWSDGSATIGTTNPLSTTVSGNTTYTCTATVNSCPMTASTSVNTNVSALSVGTFSATKTTLCSGILDTFTGTFSGGCPPYDVVIKNPSGTSIYTVTDTIGLGFFKSLNLTATGNYTLEITDNAGTLASQSISITVNSLPVVSVSPASASSCGGKVVQLDASPSGATSYKWSVTGSTTSATGLFTTLAATTAATTATANGSTTYAKPSANTSYTVTVTDANGCSATGTKAVNVYNALTAIATTDAQALCPGSGATLKDSASMNLGVASYVFASSSSTYSPLTGATNVGVSAIGDDVGVGNLPIGFNFNYNGALFTTFGVSSNGLIILGNTSSTFTGFSGNAISSTVNVLAPYWDDNNTTGGSVDYLLSGTSPNSILTIQWTGMHVAGSGSSSNPTLDMQVKLYENNGKIEFIYGSSSTTLSSPTAHVGISGASGVFLSTDNVSLSAVTSSSTASNVSSTPVSGTMFSFTPATPSFTYSWSQNGSSTLSSNSGNTVNVSNFSSAESFYVTATETTTGCTDIDTVDIALSNGAPNITAMNSSAGTTICYGTNTTLSASFQDGCGPFTYQWDDGAGNTYTTATVSVSPSASTNYSLVITDAQNQTASNNIQVDVTNPMPTITNRTKCTTSDTFKLSATAANSGDSLYWYTVSTGGTSVGVGSSYTTPTISTAGTTTYYVEEWNNTGSVSVSAGNSSSLSTSLTTSSSNGGLVFTTTQANVRINSIDIFVSGSGSMTFELQNSSGTAIATSTQTITGSTTALVNVALPSTFTTGVAAAGYRIICSSKASTITWYYQTGSFPYTSSPSGISITGGYGWSSTTSNTTELRCVHKINATLNSFCIGQRKPITITLTTPPSISLSVSSSSICEGLNDTLSVSSSNTNYTYAWSNSVSGSSNIVAPTSSTTYSVTATDASTGCSTNSSISISVIKKPTNVSAVLSNDTVCLGTTVNLSASARNINTIFNEDFEGSFPTTNWTYINNGTGNSWTSSTTAKSGTKAIQYSFNSFNPADAWAISPSISMIAGNTYDVRFYYKVSSSTYPEKLKVTIGSANNVASQSTVLWDNNGGANLTNTTYALGEASYSPSASGQFYLGFNCYSDLDEDKLFIDSISVIETSSLTYAWTSTPVGFTSAVQNPTSVQDTVNKIFNLTVTNSSGCKSYVSDTFNVIKSSQNLILASASTSGATEQCTEANGWTYYSHPSTPDKLLFGIYKNGNTLNATVDITVASGPQIKRNSAGSNQGHSAIMMARSWNVTPTSFSGSNPMKVRFFHTTQEVFDVLDSAAADLTLMANPSYQYANSNAVKGSFQFIKTSNVAYNPASWVGNTYPSTILNLQYTSSTINGVTYSEFDSVFTFSGGSGGIAVGSPSAGGLGKSGSGAIALPVTWGTIAATAVNEGNRVEWNTESEKNTNYFEVEYSYDARQFTTASPQVKAAGNSATARSYSFLHENEYSELVYYRIKQVDLDGKADYSKMVAVKRTTKLPEFSVSFYPVPLNVEALTVKIQTGQKTDVQVQIKDLLGRTVYTQTITPAGYETTEKLNVGHLPNGTYHVTIDNGANRIDRSIVIAK